MKLSTLAVASALALASLPLAAQQRITVNIGSSHPTTNIWAYAMKEVFQPEVDRILPLEIQPAPDKLVRVLVGRLEIVSPEAEAELAALLNDAGSGSVAFTAADRDARFVRLGRFLEPHLRSIRAPLLTPKGTSVRDKLIAELERSH